jgi:hypothetical protein
MTEYLFLADIKNQFEIYFTQYFLLNIVKVVHKPKLITFMNKHLIIAITAGAFISISGCNKKDYNSAGTSYTSIVQAFNEIAPQSKTVTLNAGTGGTFYGNSGTRYVFPANVFRTKTGAMVTGDVQITVTEYKDKADMLFSGVLPISGGQPLISGGETNVVAKQNNTELAIQGTYQANMPMGTTHDPEMKVFSGHENGTNSGSPVPLGVTWLLNETTSAGTIVYNGDTTVITSDSLEFCNADHFMTSPNYQSFTVTLSTQGNVSFDDDKVQAFALYDQYNGVWQMYSIGNHVVNEYHVPDIPVHFVVVGLVNGQLYAGITGATPATGSNYNVVMKPTTPSELKAQIKAL